MKRNQTLNKTKNRIKGVANQKVVPGKSEVEKIPKRFRTVTLTVSLAGTCEGWQWGGGGGGGVCFFIIF